MKILNPIFYDILHKYEKNGISNIKEWRGSRIQLFDNVVFFNFLIKYFGLKIRNKDFPGQSYFDIKKFDL